MRENLTKLCRVCFGEGEYNLWEHKVKLPAEHDEMEHFENDIVAREELSVQQMLSLLSKEQSGEQLNEEIAMVQLICHLCLDELVPSFLFCRKLRQANKKISAFLDKAILEENVISNDQLNVEYLVEQSSEIVEEEFLLEDDIEEKVAIIEEEVLNSENVTSEATGSDDLAENYSEVLIKEQRPSVAVAQKRRKLSKNPKIVLTGGVTQMLSHVHQTSSSNGEQHNEINATRCLQQAPVSQQKRLKLREREKSELEQGSFIVTQFIPSTTQLHLDSIYAHGDDDNQRSSAVTDNPLAGNELRTMDYAAVEIDASTSELQVNESDTLSVDINDGNSTAMSQAIYFCKYCPQAFSAANFLTTHMRKRHVCKFCTQGFRESTQLYEHIRSTHTIHKCAICSKELSSHSNLRSHIKRMHGVKLPAQVALLDYRRHRTVAKDVDDNTSNMFMQSSNADLTKIHNNEYEVQQQIIKL